MSTVSEALRDALVTGGVRAAFGVPGGQTTPYYLALEESPIRHVLMRDERSAAYAADAHARVTGSLGVCDATVGPGATNLVSGLAEAYGSSTPVLAIVADIVRRNVHLRDRGVVSQALDQRTMFAPVTKWVGYVSEPAALNGVLAHAIRLATSGRPGPVVVEIPDDVFRSDEQVEDPWEIELEPEDFRVPRHRNTPTADDVTRLTELIAAAERPLVLAGGGVVSSGAAEELTAFAARHGIPVATTMGGKGAIPEGDPWAAGVTGIFGTARANASLQAADLVVAIGCKFSQLVTHSWRSPRRDQRVVHVDIDPQEIGRTHAVVLGICADALETLRMLGGELGQLTASSWVEELTVVDDLQAGDDDRVRPAEVARAISGALGPRDVLLCDASLASGWGAQHYVTKFAGRSFLAPRGLAGTGWSGGAAVGARLGLDDDQRLVALAGDGGWGYGLVEVETAARIGAGIVYVILNNAGLGWIKHIQTRIGAQGSLYGDVDFAAVARAMGAEGARVAEIGEFRDALAQALGRRGPTVIDVLSSIEDSPIRVFDPAAVQGAYS
jgi:acetolactate synthase-1/2/3 large subunit